MKIFIVFCWVFQTLSYIRLYCSWQLKYIQVQHEMSDFSSPSLKMDEKLSVQWEDFQNNISASFEELRAGNDFADVTLACEDQDFEVHKLVLSASSPVLKALLQRTKKQTQPMIYMRGMLAKDLEALMDFIYLGEAKIFQANLPTFLAIAEELQVKELSGLKADQVFSSQEPTNFELNATFNRKPKMLNTGDPEMKPKPVETGPFKIKPKLCQTDNPKIKPKGVSTCNKVKSIISEETARLVENLYTNHNGVYTCLKCDYTSVSRGHLKEHVVKHIEGLKYQCNLCGKNLSSSQSFRGHLRKYH